MTSARVYQVDGPTTSTSAMLVDAVFWSYFPRTGRTAPLGLSLTKHRSRRHVSFRWSRVRRSGDSSSSLISCVQSRTSIRSASSSSWRPTRA